MKGQYFIHVAPDAVNPDVRQVRRGQIAGTVGQDFWLLRFQGKGYTWNAVVPTAALQEYALFDTLSASQAWFAETFPAPKPVEPPPESLKTEIATSEREVMTAE